jgi:hypothetical protein
MRKLRRYDEMKSEISDETKKNKKICKKTKISLDKITGVDIFALSIV